MRVGWEPGGCGWGGRSRGRVQQLRTPCHPRSGAWSWWSSACLRRRTWGSGLGRGGGGGQKGSQGPGCWGLCMLWGVFWSLFGAWSGASGGFVGPGWCGHSGGWRWAVERQSSEHIEVCWGLCWESHRGCCCSSPVWRLWGHGLGFWSCRKIERSGGVRCSWGGRRQFWWCGWRGVGKRGWGQGWFRGCGPGWRGWWWSHRCWERRSGLSGRGVLGR